MKYFLTSLLIISITSVGISQVNFPFPDSDAIWVNTDYAVVFDTTPIPSYELRYVENYCMNEQDTVINSNSYSKIFICDSAYKGAIREIDQKVYFVPKDSVQEFLLYDFSVLPGDSLFNIYMEYTYNQGGFLADIVVHQVDSILIHDQYRKLINVEYSFWIEGIGCQQGLFVHPFTNVSQAFHELHCMSQNETTIYPEYSSGSCSLTVGIKEWNFNESRVILYPNPTEKGLNISVSDNVKIIEINIINLTGQKIFHESGDLKHIDISELEAGIYIIEIVTKKSRITETLIKK